MIIQMGTDVDESRIMWKYSEDDTWKSRDIDELIDSYENNYTESYEMQIDDLKKEISDLQAENRFLKAMQRYAVMNGYAESTIPLACRECSNHPSNGSSGICHCTLGGYTIT